MQKKADPCPARAKRRACLSACASAIKGVEALSISPCPATRCPVCERQIHPAPANKSCSRKNASVLILLTPEGKGKEPYDEAAATELPAEQLVEVSSDAPEVGPDLEPLALRKKKRTRKATTPRPPSEKEGEAGEGEGLPSHIPNPQKGLGGDRVQQGGNRQRKQEK